MRIDLRLEKGKEIRQAKGEAKERMEKGTVLVGLVGEGEDVRKW